MTGPVTRVPMALEGLKYVYWVEESQVDPLLEQGYRKLRRRDADTGQVPVQRP